MTTVLVTGATGRQGGAAAAALLRDGVPVRALVRDESTEPARALARQGAELVRGDLDDEASLERACDGVRAVFSVQRRPTSRAGYGLQQAQAPVDAAPVRADAELVQGLRLVAVARAAGVLQFVQASASAVGRFPVPLPEPGAPPDYAESKGRIEHAVRTAGFDAWTILRPSAFLENFLHYLDDDRLVTGYDPEARIPVVAVRDIGAAAALAFAEPARLHGVELELAGELCTVGQVAEAMSAAWGRPVQAPVLTLDEAVAAGLPASTYLTHGRVGLGTLPARPEYARAFGIPLTGRLEWAAAVQ
jgi:uncharacterized protein YbjT (DUF2867 family)